MAGDAPLMHARSGAPNAEAGATTGASLWVILRGARREPLTEISCFRYSAGAAHNGPVFARSVPVESRVVDSCGS